MVCINTAAELCDFEEVFDTIGVSDGSVLIRIVNDGTTVFHATDIDDPISLGRAIIDDLDDRQRLGIVDFDLTLVKFWGGQLVSSGLRAPTADALRRARLPGGGLIIDGVDYPILGFVAGDAIGDVVLEWFITARGRRGMW